LLRLLSPASGGIFAGADALPGGGVTGSTITTPTRAGAFAGGAPGNSYYDGSTVTINAGAGGVYGGGGGGNLINSTTGVGGAGGVIIEWSV
jgi:hypothetical protein